jgi:hypothetical protein
VHNPFDAHLGMTASRNCGPPEVGPAQLPTLTVGQPGFPPRDIRSTKFRRSRIGSSYAGAREHVAVLTRSSPKPVKPAQWSLCRMTARGQTWKGSRRVRLDPHGEDYNSTGLACFMLIDLVRSEARIQSRPAKLAGIAANRTRIRRDNARVCNCGSNSRLS